MDVAKRIKELRKQKGISAETIAERLGTNPTTIYRYEKGDIEKMPISVLEPIAEVLGCTPAYLMGWEDEKKNDNKEGTMKIKEINGLQAIVVEDISASMMPMPKVDPEAIAKQTKLLSSFNKLNNENKDKVISYAEFTYSQQKDTVVKHAKPYVNKKKIKSGLGEITDQLGDRVDAVTITAKDFGEGLKAFLNTPLGPTSSEKVISKKEIG